MESKPVRYTILAEGMDYSVRTIVTGAQSVYHDAGMIKATWADGTWQIIPALHHRSITVEEEL